MESKTNNQRIITVDALRGFALLGILFAHFIYWYSGAGLPGEVYGKFNDIGSQVANNANGILIFGKFFTFFSFLFGLSFYLQMESLQKTERNFIALYAWRLLILGAIGLFHHALWRGDILSIYVPLGFVLLFIRNISNRLLFIIAILFVVNVPARLIQVIDFFSQHQPSANGPGLPDKESQRYFDIIKSGSFIEMIKDNWIALKSKFDFQFGSGRIYITLGFFMLGMYAGRRQWFKNPEQARPIFKRICKISGWSSLVIILFFIALTFISQSTGLALEQKPVFQLIGATLFDTVNTTMTIFYISGLTMLMYRVKWQKILFPFSYIGRMALTSYVMQTFFGLLLFYSFGFGLFLKTSPGLNCLLAIPVFALQVMLARWWFKYFKYGPIEWLWRSLTFLRWQPMRRKTIAEVATG
jgi:uncharacterized protein